MTLLSRRALLAVASVLDVALHARPAPVPAKALAARHGLGPRHLEAILQALVRGGILKSVRGPRGGYELARERRRISVADVLRTVEAVPDTADARAAGLMGVVLPAVSVATRIFLTELEGVTVDDLCTRAEAERSVQPERQPDFTI